MKKIRFLLPVLLITAMTACNNGDKDASNNADTTEKAKADSLENEVNEGHNVAMPKSIKIPAIQKEVQRMIDSIGKLPAKAREAATPYKARLEELQKELEYAGFAMDKWMSEYKYDSAINDLKVRIKYLSDEKLKVDKMKDAVLTAVQRADSLIKKKF